MQRYPQEVIKRVRHFRSLGKTYLEIKQILNIKVPKSTLSNWCENVKLPPEYATKISELNKTNLHKGRSVALVMNKIKREKFLIDLKEKNTPIAKKVYNKNVAKIALAMLCLGEAAKTRGSFSLGSSDPRIIILFIELLKKCFTFNIEKIRCTVQCRADQDIDLLEAYWLEVTKMPKRLFYKARIDPRTKGKPTKKSNYKGVLKIDYFDTKVQIELQILADLLYNQFVQTGPEV